MISHCFKLHRFYLISFNLSSIGEISGLESERMLSKFTYKENEIFFVVFTCSIKRAREIRKFGVAVVQRRLRKLQESVITCKVVVLLI